MDYTMGTCGCYICILSDPAVALFDTIAHYLLPICIIVIFSVSLLVRVLYQKYRSRGRIEWRNYRKMAVQLLSIAAIYFFFVLPFMCLNALYTVGVTFDVTPEYLFIATYVTNCGILLTPFVCAVSLPELRSKCRQVFRFGRGNDVHPASATIKR